MDGNTMRTLREYIHELRRRDWERHGTSGHSGFDTTLESHSSSEQGSRGGDAGHDQHNQRKSRDNL